MSTLASVLKDEIVRLARKEVRAQIEPVRKACVAYRHQIAELKRVATSLEREIKALSRSRKEPKVASTEQKPSRFVAKGLRALRARLGLSAEDFGLLAEVSGQSVRNWEAKIAVPGKDNRDVLFSLRPLGKREAQERLLIIKTKARNESQRRHK